MTTASDDGVTTLRCPDHGIDHNDDDGWHDGSACQHAWTSWASSLVDALAEYRLCSRCGEMDQQWIPS